MIRNISIIIVTLNEENYLPKLLSSIVKQDYKGKLEVIIVDGQSTDNTVAIAHSFKNSIKALSIICTRANISYQRNIGAKKAQYETLIFLDADMVLSQNFLSRISSQNIIHEQFIGIPLILPLNGALIDYCYTFLSYLFKVLLSTVKPVITGKCLVTSKINHKNIGGFNDKAIFAEDIDYGVRSFTNGARYHIFFKTCAYSSIRRRREMGIIRLNILQLRAYLHNIRKGAIENVENYDYPFGKH